MDLLNLTTVRNILSHLENTEVVERNVASFRLRRDLAQLYINRVGELVDSRKKILIDVVDSTLEPFNKIMPSILLRMILDYFELSTKSVCDAQKPVIERRLIGVSLAHEYERFYLRWSEQLQLTEIFNCGLSLQDACKTTFEFLSAIYCMLWGDLMVISKYRVDAITRLEKAKALFRVRSLGSDSSPNGLALLKEQLLSRSSIRNCYKGGARNLDLNKWKYIFANEKANGLFLARRADIRNKASYSRDALHTWFLQEGYYSPKMLNKITNIGDKYSDFGNDIADLLNNDG